MPASKKVMDFTNVKESGNFRPRHKPEGDYIATVVDVEDATSNSGNEQWVFAVKLSGDERSLYPVYCGQDDKQAWKIRKMFVGAGVPVPKKRVMVDPNKLVGKTLGVTLEDDEYEGRMRSKIVDFLLADEVMSPDDSSEEEVYNRPASKAKVTTKKKAAPVIEDDDDEDEDTDDEDETPRRAAKKTTAPRQRRAPVEEELDDDEEDEPPAPRRAASKKAAPAKKVAARRRPPVEDDDDEDLDLDEL